jgi:hypothetical protein
MEGDPFSTKNGSKIVDYKTKEKRGKRRLGEYLTFQKYLEHLNSFHTF